MYIVLVEGKPVIGSEICEQAQAIANDLAHVGHKTSIVILPICMGEPFNYFEVARAVANVLDPLPL